LKIAGESQSGNLMSVQTVGRYEILGELGRGAMGVVYKAQDPTIGRVVALKTMRLDVHGLENEDVLRRFKNEARAAGILNHPNIVTIYDAGEQEGLFYIAMEFIEGTTLHSILAERRVLPPEEIIEISRQICKGLDYAHSNGIVHRDIKPANIMITGTGAVKIMDFGIAKAGGGMTSTGQVLGTPNYMSPEQVKGKTLDGRSDLFSFGVVLYEMVTGEKPFVGQNVTTIIYKIVHENPISPRDLDVTIHPGLSAVVTKALAKQPDERYQRGAELISDLENYKSVGSSLSATAVLPTSAVSVSDPTQMLTHGSAVAAAAASPARVALRQPAEPSRTKWNAKRGALEIVLFSIVILAAAIGGYGYYRYRNALKVEKADRDLEQKLKEQEMEQAAAATAIKASETAVQQQQAAAVPTPTPSPEARASVSPNKVFKDQGELRFDSQPRGAKVSVDGWTEPGWVTPFPASNLGVGQHTIVFSKPGYIAETRKVKVVVGKSLPVSVQLNPAVSKIEVSSTPPGANIEVDGIDTGKITPAEITVEKGQHTVLLRKAGFKDIWTTVNLDDGQTATFAPLLVPPQPETQMSQVNRPGFWKKIFGGSQEPIPPGKGVVYIHTIPEGATIQVGNRVAPYKTNVVWPVEPGTYQIQLTMDGYKAVRRTVRVQKGQPVYVDEILEKQR
jgi:predicted Ser/Thr protein kinase